MSEPKSYNCISISAVRFAGPGVEAEVMGVMLPLLKLRPEISGIIVASFKYENLEPVHYWDIGGCYSEFEEHGMQTPRKYKSVKWAQERIEKMKQYVNGEKLFCDAAFWFAQEVSSSVPLEKYMKMTGGQFPGSVRR